MCLSSVVCDLHCVVVEAVCVHVCARVCGLVRLHSQLLS